MRPYEVTYSSYDTTTSVNASFLDDVNVSKSSIEELAGVWTNVVLIREKIEETALSRVPAGYYTQAT